ncbi:hypothetical protein Tco_0038186 [Tanacetum coccineum]
MASTQASSSNPPKKIKFTIILPRKLFVDLTQEDDETHTPSPIEKSSSSSPPNAPSKTSSTKETSSIFGTTSSSFESKTHFLLLSLRNTPSTQPTNPFLDDTMDAPSRPSNPLPLQSHPSLDITLYLSPITPLDHMFETPTPPQPPLMGHPIYFNILDYHGAHCLVLILGIGPFHGLLVIGGIVPTQLLSGSGKDGNVTYQYVVLRVDGRSYLLSGAMMVRISIWRDVRTLAIEEAYTTKYSIHPGADTMLCGFRLTNRWLSMKKDIASCGSKYLAYSEVEVEYQGSSGLLLQPKLPE